MKKECALLVESITALAFDSLEGPERARVLAHLEQCPACRRRLEQTAALLDTAKYLPRIKPSKEFSGRVIHAAAVERTLNELSLGDRLRLAAGSVLFRTRSSPTARFLLLAAAVQLLVFTVLYFASGLTVQVAPSAKEGAGEAGAIRLERTSGAPENGSGEPGSLTAFLPEEKPEGGGLASRERLEAPTLELALPRPAEAPLPETVLQGLDERIERENRLELLRCRMDARFSVPWRKEVLKRHGGDHRTAAAVEKGLRWLRDHQKGDGSWPVGGPFGGDPRVTPGITALGVAALLSDGHTERSGRFAGTVRRAVGYLLSVQDREGRFGWIEGHPLESLFNQGTTVLTLSENYILCGRDRHEGALERGIRALVAMSDPARDPEGLFRGYGDAWAAMALRTASITGLHVPGLMEAAARAEERVARLAGKEIDRGGEGPGRVADLPPLCTATTLALEALFRQPAGPVKERDGVPFPDPARPASLYAFLDDPAYREPSFLFFTGTALCERDGAQWEPWNRKVKTLLLEEQEPNGLWPARGQWPWIDGGDLYTTVLDLLTLQVYYRYVRLEELSRDR